MRDAIAELGNLHIKSGHLFIKTPCNRINFTLRSYYLRGTGPRCAAVRMCSQKVGIHVVFAAYPNHSLMKVNVVHIIRHFGRLSPFITMLIFYSLVLDHSIDLGKVCEFQAGVNLERIVSIGGIGSGITTTTTTTTRLRRSLDDVFRGVIGHLANLYGQHNDGSEG